MAEVKDNVKQTKLSMLHSALDVNRVRLRRLKKNRRLWAGTLQLYQDWLVQLNLMLERQVREIMVFNTFVDCLDNIIFKVITDPWGHDGFVGFKINHRNLIANILSGARSRFPKNRHLGAVIGWVSVPKKKINPTHCILFLCYFPPSYIPIVCWLVVMMVWQS